MGLQTTYEFDDAQNYEFDSDAIELGVDALGNTVARLKSNPLLEEVIGYWKGTGDATDSGPNGLDGTWVGTEAYATLGSFQAFSFDGASYVTVGPDAQLEVDDGDFTVLCTFSVSDFSVNRFLFDKGTGGYVDGYGGYIDTAGRIIFVTDGSDGAGAKYYLPSTTIITPDTQYTVAFVRRNGVKEIWINGTQEANTQADARELTDTTRPFLIGKSEYDSGGEFLGTIGQVALIKRALTEEEIQAYASDKRIKKYSTDNPTIEVKYGFYTTGVISGSQTATEPTGTEIKRIALVNNVPMWYNTSTGVWEESNGTYDQSNTETEMGPHLQELDLSSGVLFRIRFFLHSDDGENTPELDKVMIEYNYYMPPSSIDMVTVYGYVRDIFGNGVEDVEVKVDFYDRTPLSKEKNTVFIKSRTTRTNVNGYWAVSVPKPTTFQEEVKYIFTFSTDDRTQTYIVSIPNDQDIIEFGDLL